MEFITTLGINNRLNNLLNNANRKIMLISPYIQFERRIKAILIQKKQDGLEIIIVCRKADLKEPIAEYATKVIDVPTLHAKCYMSESEAIITSLNLYEFSQINNDEMGIHIHNDESSKKIYNDISIEANRLIDSGIEVEPTIGKPPEVDTIKTDTEEEPTPYSLKIIKVDIVNGRDINPIWRDKMQKVYTTRGIYIAELPNKRNDNGYVWSNRIGDTLEPIEFNIPEEYNGVDWLYKTKFTK